MEYRNRSIQTVYNTTHILSIGYIPQSLFISSTLSIYLSIFLCVARFTTESIFMDGKELNDKRSALERGVPKNIALGSYSSPIHYLHTQFYLLREDCFHTLRSGTSSSLSSINHLRWFVYLLSCRNHCFPWGEIRSPRYENVYQYKDTGYLLPQ